MMMFSAHEMKYINRYLPKKLNALFIFKFHRLHAMSHPLNKDVLKIKKRFFSKPK